jgi:hypothetical protein
MASPFVAEAQKPTASLALQCGGIALSAVYQHRAIERSGGLREVNDR